MEKTYYNKNTQIRNRRKLFLFNRKHFLFKKSIGNTILNEETLTAFLFTSERSLRSPFLQILFSIVLNTFFSIFYYGNMLPTTDDHFTSFLPLEMPFIYFSWLIVLASTSNIILNKNDESGYT